MKWPTHTPTDVQLPQVLKQCLRGLRAGGGSSSARLLSMTAGVQGVLKPIVLSLYAGTGLRRFLTALATTYALREEASGEHMVTLCWDLERAALKSLIETSQSDGDSDVISFELSIAAEGPATTSPNTFSRHQMFGIQGARCDFCGEAFQKDQSYTTICSPELQSLHLYHSECMVVRPAKE